MIYLMVGGILRELDSKFKYLQWLSTGFRNHMLNQIVKKMIHRVLLNM